MPDHKATIIDPFTAIESGEQGGFPFDLFGGRCLAQGDSWFSIGSIPPGLTSNVLDELVLTDSVVIVNCARPGKVLRHMTDTCSEPLFLRLLTGNLAMKWDAILISGGGNDLIDAATVPPSEPAEKRLFATEAERGPGPLAPEGYLSEPGWQTFATHIGAVFGELVARRDAGVNRHVPMLFHSYTHFVPRPAAAGLGHGPWLHPAMEAFAIPAGDRVAVSAALSDRLVLLLQHLIADRLAADPNGALQLVDSRAAPLQGPDPDADGPSGDFQNEIHLTRDGYRKVAEVWRQSLDAVV